MASVITPDKRVQILNSIKEGTTIQEAADAHGIRPKTITSWMRNGTRSHSSELQKAKKHIAFLESIILELVLEQKAANRKG